MDTTVLVALISAGGAIIVALIALIPHLPKKGEPTGQGNQNAATSPRRIKIKGQWFGDNELWDLQGDVEIERRIAQGRIWWKFVKCGKPSTKSASWLKRVGDSSFEDVKGTLDIDSLTLNLRGYEVGDITLLNLGLNKTVVFSHDWQTFKGTTSDSSQRTCLSGTLEGSASVEFN